MSAANVTPERIAELRKRVEAGGPANAWRLSDYIDILDALEAAWAERDALRAQLANQKIEVPEPTGFTFFGNEGDNIAQRHRDVVQGIRWARLNAKIVPSTPAPDVVTEKWLREFVARNAMVAVPLNLVDQVRQYISRQEQSEESLRLWRSLDALRAQLAAWAVEVPELVYSGACADLVRNVGGDPEWDSLVFRVGYDYARSCAKIVPSAPAPDTVTVESGRPLSEAPTDRPILAFWPSDVGIISDVVHYHDDHGRFVCWCEFLEEDGDLDRETSFVPRDARWIELPEALRPAPPANEGRG